MPSCAFRLCLLYLQPSTNAHQRWGIGDTWPRRRLLANTLASLISEDLNEYYDLFGMLWYEIGITYFTIGRQRKTSSSLPQKDTTHPENHGRNSFGPTTRRFAGPMGKTNTSFVSGADKPMSFVVIIQVTWTSFHSEKPFGERKRENQSAIISLDPRKMPSGIGTSRDPSPKKTSTPTPVRLMNETRHGVTELVNNSGHLQRNS